MGSAMIVPIIFMIILLMLFVVFLMLSSKQEKVYKTIDEKGNVKNDKPLEAAPQANAKAAATTTATDKPAYKKEDVFKFMEFDRILDNMIVQNGGSRFTMAIRCKGINYDLMSEVEQLSVEEGFITFLNTLKYPIQLYVQAQNVDLKGNVSTYKSNIEELTKEYNEVNEEYNKMSGMFDVDENELNKLTEKKDKISNVYEYAHDIIRYVEKMSTNKNLLQRKFYILLSYNTSEINAADKFSKDELVEMCATELMTRCKGIIGALSSCSVSGETLNSNELADLLYSAYNRDDKSLMSVGEAIQSGMLRLYSTSEDAFAKQEAQLDEYLKNQAQLKAYKAIKYAMENDEIETPASEVLDREEEVARRATNYVKYSDYPDEQKEKATRKILNDFREEKKELNDIHQVQKNEILKQAQKDVAKIPELENTEVPHGVQLIEKSKASINGQLPEENKVEQPENVAPVIEETPKTEEVENTTIQSPVSNQVNNVEEDLEVRPNVEPVVNPVNPIMNNIDDNLYSNEEDDSIV